MRESYEGMANDLDVEFYGFWLEVDEQTQMQRVRERRVSMVEKRNVSYVSEKQASSVKVDGEVSWCRVDATDQVEKVVQNVFSKLNL